MHLVCYILSVMSFPLAMGTLAKYGIAFARSYQDNHEVAAPALPALPDVGLLEVGGELDFSRLLESEVSVAASSSSSRCGTSQSFAEPVPKKAKVSKLFPSETDFETMLG